MRSIPLGKSGMQVPTVAVGCMGLSGLSDRDAGAFVDKALELGCNFFDHADIYGDGECERVFARAVGMNPSVREKLILQSKCGIVVGGRQSAAAPDGLSGCAPAAQTGRADGAGGGGGGL